MELDKAIQSRKSVRKFNSKKPDWREIIECIDSARYAPMAGGNYTLRFIVISDGKKIEKLADAAQQDFIKQAKYVVVACTEPKRTINAYEEKGKIFCRQQAGAGIQNFLLKIQEKGLSTCWVGYFVERIVKEILKIPKDINVEALFPIGYEYKYREPKTKIDIDRILYFHQYKNKKMKKPRVINA